MRIGQVSDVHLDLIATRLGKFKIENGENLFYKERLSRFTTIIHDLVYKYQCSMIAITGDLFNRQKPFPQEIWDVARVLDSIPHNVRVVVIPGNHDEKTQRGCALQPLQERRPHVEIHLEPARFFHEGIDFIVAPWGTTLDVLHQLRSIPLKEGAPRSNLDPVLLAHLGTTLEGKHWTEVEGEIGSISLHDLKSLHFRAGLLGHYHGQTDLGNNIWYAGSPECFNFGESEQSKGFLLWDIDSSAVTVHPLQIASGPKYYTFKVKEFLEYKEEGFAGYVKIQGEATEEQKALVLAKLETFSCEDYKLDLQSSLKQTRVAQLKGQTNIEILVDYFKNKQIDPAAAMLELDQSIEGEVL